MEPHEYPRRILTCVAGLSPQIITETLYALTVKEDLPFVPTEIHLLTTQEGAARARLTLLDPEEGRFSAFCRDYEIDSENILFDETTIHVFRNENNEPLDDIRTSEDNRFAADAITAQIATMTKDLDCALHVSIAGGRKTMGFYLGYALSMYGREQDRLSHVLVSPPFESEHQFYYPPPRPKILITRDNRPVSTADAEITLATIPFVMMGKGSTGRLSGDTSFSQAISRIQKHIGPPELCFDREERQLMVDGERVEMKPINTAYYLWLAIRARDGLEPIHWTEATVDEFLAAYRRVVHENSGDYERTEAALERDGITSSWISERKSRVQTGLEQALGEERAKIYQVQTFGKRPKTRNGLSLSPDQIKL